MARLTPQALFVSIGGTSDAIVWPIHYSDTRLKHPEKKFKPGAKVKGRVFAVDPSQNRVVVTLTPSLVSSEQPTFDALEAIPANTQVAGLVSKLEPSGAFVELFGGHRLLLPLGQLSDKFRRAQTVYFKNFMCTAHDSVVKGGRVCRS